MLTGHRSLTAAQQFLWLRSSPVSEGRGRLAPGSLIWTYSASPSPVSRVYEIRIEYRQGDVPRVFVMRPDIRRLAEGRRLPHVYQQEPPQLCLYYPNGEWRPWMRLDQTIVPWTDLWLFYFEEWVFSNEWKGGGLHPRPRREDSRRRRAKNP